MQLNWSEQDEDSWVDWKKHDFVLYCLLGMYGSLGIIIALCVVGSFWEPVLGGDLDFFIVLASIFFASAGALRLYQVYVVWTYRGEMLDWDGKKMKNITPLRLRRHRQALFFGSVLPVLLFGLVGCIGAFVLLSIPLMARYF